MRPIARRATLAVAATALTMGTLSACGGDDDEGGSSAPENASTEEFCEEFGSLFQDVLSEGLSGDTGALVTAMKEWAEDMQEVGTPEDMPDEAREGFEVFLDEARSLPDDATAEDLDQLGEDLPQSEQDAADTFGDWAAETCPDALLPDVPTDLPSDLGSDLPTDPSELESMMSELTQDAE